MDFGMAIGARVDRVDQREQGACVHQFVPAGPLWSAPTLTLGKIAFYQWQFQ
jgi:hypothetical protein